MPLLPKAAIFEPQVGPAYALRVGPAYALTSSRDQIREEQEGGHVMAIGDVEMKPLGVGFDPVDLGGEVRQVGGPQGG